MSKSKREIARLSALGGVMLMAVGSAGCAHYEESYVEEVMVPSEAEAIRETTVGALENNPVGESSSWSNAETGGRGTVMPTRTYEDTADGPCREFQQTYTKEGETAFAYGTACREPDGTWETVDYSGWHESERRYSGYPYGRGYYGYPYYRYPPYYHAYGPRIGFHFGHHFH